MLERLGAIDSETAATQACATPYEGTRRGTSEGRVHQGGLRSEASRLDLIASSLRELHRFVAEESDTLTRETFSLEISRSEETWAKMSTRPGRLELRNRIRARDAIYSLHSRVQSISAQFRSFCDLAEVVAGREAPSRRERQGFHRARARLIATIRDGAAILTRGPSSSLLNDAACSAVVEGETLSPIFGCAEGTRAPNASESTERVENPEGGAVLGR